MNRKIHQLLSLLLAAAFAVTALATGTAASAAGSVYVNDASGVLSGELSSAYAVGDTGTVSTVGGAYAITGDGTVVKVGDSASPSDTETPEAPFSGTVSLKGNTVKIGLYYKTASFDTAVSTSTLTNTTGGGFRLGYFDSSRVFCEIGSTADTQVTIQTDPNGSGVLVTNAGGQQIFSSSGGGYALAVSPIATGKSITKISNNGYTYYGDFVFERYNGNTKLTVINVLNIEDYVKGVIPYEMIASWPVEALKAGAIAARNYVQANCGKYASYGFDIVNTASDQVYGGTRSATANTNAACDATANQYLTYSGKLVSAFYYAANGGASENSENVFVNPLGYCKGKPDPFEGAIDFYCKSWSKSFTSSEISGKLSSLNLAPIASITTTNTAAGNVLSVIVTDVKGQKVTYSRSSCLTFLTRLGMPYTSMRFTVSYDAAADKYTVSGSGAGHNVGMSQWGACAMASVYNKNYREILGFYYTGVAISQGVSNS